MNLKHILVIIFILQLSESSRLLANNDNTLVKKSDVMETTDVSFSGNETNGVVQKWHLDVHKGDITPETFKQPLTYNLVQKFTLINNARGAFITGGASRKNGFLKVQPEEIYKIEFYGRIEGNVSCYCKCIGFEKRTWKSGNEEWKKNIYISSSEWKKYTAFIKAPLNHEFVIVTFQMQGEGSIYLKDFSMSTIRRTKMPTDCGKVIIQKGYKKMKSDVNMYEEKPHASASIQTSKHKTTDKDYGTHIITENGVPALYSFGKKLSPQIMYNSTWNPEQVIDDQSSFFASAGVGINFIPCSLPWSKKSPSGKSAEIAGSSFSNLNSRISNILKMNPDAKFLLNVHLFAPADWFEKYPKEILTAENGQKVFLGNRPMSAVSYASLKWRHESEKRLRILSKFLDEQSYSKNILGVVLFFGWSGEWNWWIPPKDIPNKKIYPQLASLGVDYSLPNQHLYQQWLTNKYGDIESLNKLWKTKHSKFSEIRPPSQKTISDSKYSTLKSPSENIEAIDYFSYYSDMMADCLLEISHSVKGNSSIPRLVGAYFGGILHQAVGGAKNIQRSGHLSLEKILNSPDIDFLCNPNFYPTDAVGQYCPGNNFISSLNLHGKMYFFEYDHPTSCQKKGKEIHNNWRTIKSLKDSISVIQRDFCWSLCNNAGIWWWDMDRQYIGNSWFSAPEIRDNIKNFQRIELEALKKDRTSVSEIAVIFSLKSYIYMTTRSDSIGRDIVVKQIDALGKTGAPFDLYLLDDIKNIKPYKLYIFWNTFAVTETQRAIIKQKLERENATALWIYAPGFIDPEKNICGDNIMSDLTGIKLIKSDDAEFAKTEITNPDCIISKQYYNKTIGNDDTLEPYFYAGEEQELVILGRAPFSGKPNFVLKQSENRSNIFIGAYPVPAEILSTIAYSAGVHLYTDAGDVVMANHSYLSFHFITEGHKKIKLPTTARVYDEFKKKLISPKCNEFVVDAKKNETKLFLIENK